MTVLLERPAPDLARPIDDVPPVTEVVLIGHGSPDPRHRRGVKRISRTTASMTGLAVDAAFLEHDHPRAATRLDHGAPRSVHTEPRHTVVLPLLLTAGYHWHHDLPTLTATSGQRWTLLEPPDLTELAPAVLDLVPIGFTGRLVLAGAGSSRPHLRERFEDLAVAMSVLAPTVSSVVAVDPQAVSALAGPRDLVVPVLVAEGVFSDRIRTAAFCAGARCSPPLGQHPAFAGALARRIRNATPRPRVMIHATCAETVP